MHVYMCICVFPKIFEVLLYHNQVKTYLEVYHFKLSVILSDVSSLNTFKGANFPM